MSKVGTSDNHEPASFRAYFWSYSTQKLAEDLSEELGAELKQETDVEWSLQVGEGTWTITGASPVCVIARILNEDSLDAVELLMKLESLRGPWKIEWLDQDGRVVKEQSSEDPPLGSEP